MTILQTLTSWFFALFTSVLSVLFTPLDNFLYSYLPNLGESFTAVGSFISYVFTFIVWVVSWIPISTPYWQIIFTLLMFKFTVPIGVNTLKLFIKWWHYLVP